MTDEWPTRGDLFELERDAREHQRAWTLVGALAERLRTSDEHRAPIITPKCGEHVARIQALEAKVIAQKEMLRKLDECRAWEAESEAKLLSALRRAGEDDVIWSVRSLATRALAENAVRKGPRPEPPQ